MLKQYGIWMWSYEDDRVALANGAMFSMVS